MRVIAKSTLEAFWARHADAEQPLKAWHAEVAKAAWRGPSDIRRRYASASFLPDNRVVFNIKGNEYRLVVHVKYDFGIVFVKFVGTHAEYDRINATTIKHR